MQHELEHPHLVAMFDVIAVAAQSTVDALSFRAHSFCNVPTPFHFAGIYYFVTNGDFATNANVVLPVMHLNFILGPPSRNMICCTLCTLAD